MKLFVLNNKKEYEVESINIETCAENGNKYDTANVVATVDVSGFDEAMNLFLPINCVDEDFCKKFDEETMKRDFTESTMMANRFLDCETKKEESNVMICPYFRNLASDFDFYYKLKFSFVINDEELSKLYNVGDDGAIGYVTFADNSKLCEFLRDEFSKAYASAYKGEPYDFSEKEKPLYDPATSSLFVNNEGNSFELFTTLNNMVINPNISVVDDTEE